MKVTKTIYFIVLTLWGFFIPWFCYGYNNLTEGKQMQINSGGTLSIHVDQEGTLSQLIDLNTLLQYEELKVTGEINSDDVSFMIEASQSTDVPMSFDLGEALYKGYTSNWSSFRAKELSIPEGVTYVGTFKDNASIESLTLPRSATEIGRYAFEGSSIKEITLLSAMNIGEWAFKNCRSLERFTMLKDNDNLQENNVVIRTNAFFACSNLKEVNLCEGIIGIETYAFSGCIRLSYISIPKSIRYLQNGVFSQLKNLEKVRFASIDHMCNIEYADNEAKPTRYAHSIYIGDDDDVIKNVVFPSSVTTIGEYLFRDCQHIESVTVPESVTTIASAAFAGCSNLEFLKFTSKTVPGSIGSGIVPDDVVIVVPPESYSNYCACPGLKKNNLEGHIVFDESQLDQIIDVTAESSNSGILSVMGEDGMRQVYKLKINGSINGYDILMIRNKMPNLKHLDMTQAQIVANPFEYYQGCHSEDHRLGTRMFQNMGSLRSIMLPKSITYIDSYAFGGCSKLRDVTISEGVVGLGKYSFSDCASLTSIIIPSGVRAIDEYSFSNCKQLRQIKLGEGLIEIGTMAFVDNEKLQSIILPSTVEVIRSYAFYRCVSLEEVLLGDNIREMQSSIFDNCSSLKEIRIPPKVTSISSYSFSGCSSLKQIHIPTMVETIGEGAFARTPNLDDIYVYLANPKDIEISQNTFSTWKSATLHVPSFGYFDYYMHSQWGQFAHIVKFDEPYEKFYTKNTIVLDSNTGIIDGTPDALFYEHGSLEVNDNEVQPLDEVHLVHNGKDCASLIPEQTGNITVEMLGIDINVRANSWHFFSFPFDIDLASIKYDGDYIWRQYDGAKRSRREGGWQNLADGTAKLQAKRGYIFWGTTAGVLHLEVSHPEITAENVNTELKTYATADTDPADASWNFIGNPYTSYYAVDEATYAAPITIWTGNGYEAYRPGDDDYEFAPYEAFFVQTPTGTNAVNFNADNREGYEQAQETQSNRRMARAQKKVNPNRLLVNLELGVQGEEEYLDKTRVVFNDECSLDYESDCDAAKFFSEERRAELYTIGADGTQYAINERPEDGGYVELGFVANQKGKYSISAPRMDVPMLLVDDVMETTFDLRNGAYEFSSAKGTFNKRFYLKRYEGITTSIKDLADQIGMNFCISDGTISIEGLNDTTRVCLYNMAGQQIATQQGNGTFTAIPGTYVISVGKLSAKIIVK